MFTRKTRAQIIILENGKFVLLKHHFKPENQFFWGVPGGGVEPGETAEQAAIREAKEETGLTVKLLPFKWDMPMQDSVYQNAVTFLAYPVAGTARVGYDPEPEATNPYNLIDIRWQNFFEDQGIDDITRSLIAPFRKYVLNGPFVKRAGTLVYRTRNNHPEYLLVSGSQHSKIYIFPQGHHEDGETLAETARRETFEEAGVEASIHKELGFFLHKGEKSLYRTHIFAASFCSQYLPQEPRQVRWCTFEEAQQLPMHREGRRFLQEFHAEHCSA
jgi:8-oxo-dGTP pyrophosphatase MutT (NUDIX family)